MSEYLDPEVDAFVRAHLGREIDRVKLPKTPLEGRIRFLEDAFGVSLPDDLKSEMARKTRKNECFYLLDAEVIPNLTKRHDTFSPMRGSVVFWKAKSAD